MDTTTPALGNPQRAAEPRPQHPFARARQAGHGQSTLKGGSSKPFSERQRPLHETDPGPRTVKLSILMPAYNEERTIARALANVMSVDYPCDFEVIVVDDGSTDRTLWILEQFAHPKLVLVRHPRNLGKGAALQSACTIATGTHLVPFDADLEYEAADLLGMLDPVLRGRADVVYGPRLFGMNTRYQSYRHAMGNRVLTLAANMLFDSYLSDMHTCLKIVPVDLFQRLALSEDGFGLDTEVTAKLLKLGIRPFEVPVTYYSRSVEQGKKITWRDGLECLQVLLRVRWIAMAAVSRDDPVLAGGGRLGTFEPVPSVPEEPVKVERIAS
jgi:hypothetical protein